MPPTTAKAGKVLAWHWLASPGKLSNNDPRPVIVGETLTHKGDIKLCKSGLHASERALDSLEYAPGNILCRVECSGKIERDNTKLVCTQRKCLWIVDAKSTLRAFARRCASDVLHLWAAPDIVKEYLASGDETKRDAAGAAARAAAWDAAGAAAWDAAWPAARAAALDRYNAWLEEMLLALAPMSAPKKKARKQ